MTMKDKYPHLFNAAIAMARKTNLINSTHTEGEFHNEFVEYLTSQTEENLEAAEELIATRGGPATEFMLAFCLGMTHDVHR